MSLRPCFSLPPVRRRGHRSAAAFSPLGRGFPRAPAAVAPFRGANLRPLPRALPTARADAAYRVPLRHALPALPCTFQLCDKPFVQAPENRQKEPAPILLQPFSPP